MNHLPREKTTYLNKPHLVTVSVWLFIGGIEPIQAHGLNTEAIGIKIHRHTYKKKHCKLSCKLELGSSKASSKEGIGTKLLITQNADKAGAWFNNEEGCKNSGFLWSLRL